MELAAEEQSKCLFTLSTGESDRIKRAEVKSSGEIMYLFQKEILQCEALLSPQQIPYSCLEW